jgi:hypothetical protein
VLFLVFRTPFVADYFDFSQTSFKRAAAIRRRTISGWQAGAVTSGRKL